MRRNLQACVLLENSQVKQPLFPISGRKKARYGAPSFVETRKSRPYAPQLDTERAIDHNVLSRAVSI
jgi:hypothetical protein